MEGLTPKKFKKIIEFASRPLKVAKKTAGKEPGDSYSGKKTRSRNSEDISERRNDKSR